MAKVLMYVEGIDGQVELMTDRVIVHRKGLLNSMKHGVNSRLEIPLASISGVDFQDATLLRQGMIDFDHAGKRSSGQKGKNSVKFGKKHHEQFYALKEKIFELISQTQNRK